MRTIYPKIFLLLLIISFQTSAQAFQNYDANFASEGALSFTDSMNVMSIKAHTSFDGQQVYINQDQIEALTSLENEYARPVDVFEGFSSIQAAYMANDQVAFDILSPSFNVSKIYLNNGQILDANQIIDYYSAAAGGDMGGGGKIVIMK